MPNFILTKKRLSAIDKVFFHQLIESSQLIGEKAFLLAIII